MFFSVSLRLVFFPLSWLFLRYANNIFEVDEIRHIYQIIYFSLLHIFYILKNLFVGGVIGVNGTVLFCTLHSYSNKNSLFSLAVEVVFIQILGGGAVGVAIALHGFQISRSLHVRVITGKPFYSHKGEVGERKKVFFQ